MEGTIYKTKTDVLRRAEEAVGIPLKDIDKTGRLSTGKGAIGTVIEESWYGYTPNSESEPDFPEAGVELKVTPYVRGKTGDIRAKERLVCNIINYMEEYDRTFQTSSFWVKCNTMLLMSYEHHYDRPKGEFKIDKAVLFSFPEEDLLIIEKDWETIMNKVRAGKAHLISEGDTLYLAACTKGATSASVRQQPFSNIMAKQRAYSLKGSYMTQILNQYIFGSVRSEKVIHHWEDLQDKSFEDYIIDRVKPYYGISQSSLKWHFNIEGNPKNVNELILAKMLNVTGRIANTEEFQKAGIVPKTIRVQKNGRIAENMSFPTFEFCEIIEQTWEESELYEYLAPTRFLFVIFREAEDGEFVFDQVKFWNIPNDDLDEVHSVWERTVAIIRRGVKLTQTPNQVLNNLPAQTENPVSHVRPHSSKSYYRFEDGSVHGTGTPGNASLLPDGRMMTKQCFWLNNTYIEKQIHSHEPILYVLPQETPMLKVASSMVKYQIISK